MAVAGLLVAACGDDADPVTTDPPATTPAETAPAETALEPVSTDAPDTSAAPESTVDPAVTAAPETTAPAPDTTAAPTPETTAAPAPSSPSDLTLRSNGVGAADFGQADIEVIPYVTGILGNPVRDQLGEYPTFDEEFNLYTNFDEDGFTAPFGRTTCYDNRYCLYFGGETNDALSFVGWSQESLDLLSDPLATADGITIGSRQSEHLGTMTINNFGCFTNGSGEAAGILVLVTSEGEPFEFVDEEGNFVQGNPAPEEIVVTALEAGSRPYFIFADC